MKRLRRAMGIGTLVGALLSPGEVQAENPSPPPATSAESSESGRNSPSRLDERIAQSETNPAVEKFAVLIGSSADLRERQTAVVPVLENAYSTLTDSMGYKLENVYVLISGGKGVTFPVDGRATRETWP